MDQRLGADRDLVAEHGGDLVGVAGAADVAQQRHPVRGLAHLLVEPRGLADPGREQARAQLRLQRLPERVVLRERQRGDELTEAKRRVRNGESSRCIGRRGRRTILTRRVAVSLRATDNAHLQGGQHGNISNAGGDPIKVGVIADQTGPLSFVGLANANVARMVVGDINAKGGLLGPPPRAVSSRTARPTTPWPPPRRGSSSSRTRSTSSSAASTAPRGRPSRARPWSRARRSTSTPSSTRGRSPTR